MATLSGILTWRIPWAEEPRGTVSGITESDSTGQLTLSNQHTVCQALCQALEGL